MCNEVTDALGFTDSDAKPIAQVAPTPPPPVAPPARSPRESLINEKDKKLDRLRRNKKRKLSKEEISSTRRGRSALRIPLSGSGASGNSGLNIAS